MKDSIVRFLCTLWNFIITFITDSVNSVTEGIDERSVKKVALHVTLLCTTVAVMISSVCIIVKLAIRNMPILLVVMLFTACLFGYNVYLAISLLGLAQR